MLALKHEIPKYVVYQTLYFRTYIHTWRHMLTNGLIGHLDEKLVNQTNQEVMRHIQTNYDFLFFTLGSFTNFVDKTRYLGTRQYRKCYRYVDFTFQQCIAMSTWGLTQAVKKWQDLVNVVYERPLQQAIETVLCNKIGNYHLFI